MARTYRRDSHGRFAASGGGGSGGLRRARGPQGLTQEGTRGGLGMVTGKAVKAKGKGAHGAPNRALQVARYGKALHQKLRQQAGVGAKVQNIRAPGRPSIAKRGVTSRRAYSVTSGKGYYKSERKTGRNYTRTGVRTPPGQRKFDRLAVMRRETRRRLWRANNKTARFQRI